MNLLELSKKSLFVLLLSLMALVMLPACSTTEEEAPPADTGTGVPCELDMMQPGCTKEDVDM